MTIGIVVGRMFGAHRIGWLIALTLLLGGCATLPPDRAGPDEVSAAEREAAWVEHRAQIESLTDWAVDGRAAIRSPEGGGSVQLRWVQVGVHFDMLVSAPLGQGSLRLTGKPGDVLVVDATGSRLRTSDLDAVLREQTGWPVPVAALPDWIRGLPGPEASDFELDPRGRITRIQQGPWRIELDRYRNENGYMLPGRLLAESGELRLRLIIDQWRLQQGEQDPGQEPE
ncbi:MAG: lipoprotein insertase outer membrane protein LolB [Halothiobacillaceae bacterium]